MKNEQLTKEKTLGYCFGDIFGGGAFTLVGMLYMNFLTDNMLIKGAVVGVMLFIGKIWDALIDPFIGNLSEKAKSKVGKRRVFFLAGIFHICASFVSLWLPLSNTKMLFKTIYFTFAYILFATSFSLTMVPYHAMLPELTDDQKIRNNIVSIRSIFSNASSMIAGLIPSILAQKFGYLGMGISFGIFYTIPWIIVFFSTKGLDKESSDEKEIENNDKENIFKSFISNAKLVLKNKSFRKMLGLYLLSYTAMDIFMAIFIYYFKWYLGIFNFADADKIGKAYNVLGLGSYTFFLGVFMIAELISIPFYNKMCNSIGKKKSFMISTTTWALASILFFIMSSPAAWPNKLYLLIIPAVCMGFGAGGVAYIPWAILPETMDVEELISGERKDAIYSGFLTFIRQLSQAFAMLIIGVYLTAIDEHQIGTIFNSLFPDGQIDKMTQLQYLEVLKHLDPSVGMGIKIFTSFVPFILLIGACIVASSFPIDDSGYKLIHKEIKDRNTTDQDELKTIENIVGKSNLNKVKSLQNKRPN